MNMSDTLCFRENIALKLSQYSDEQCHVYIKNTDLHIIICFLSICCALQFRCCHMKHNEIFKHFDLRNWREQQRKGNSSRKTRIRIRKVFNFLLLLYNYCVFFIHFRSIRFSVAASLYTKHNTACPIKWQNN